MLTGSVSLTDVPTRAEREADALASARREVAEILLVVRGLAIEDVDLLTTALCCLRFRSRHMVMQRSGLRDGHRYTLRELGNVWHISLERARQVEKRAREKLLAVPAVGAAWERLERALQSVAETRR